MSVITVPEQFAQWRIRVDGAAAREWVQALPALVDRLLDQWNLALDEAEPLHGGFGLVVLVHRGEQPLALKLSCSGNAVADEVRALRAWQGRSAVALLDAEPQAGAVLLERLDYRRSLHTLPLRDAAEIAGSLVRALAVAAPPGLRTLSEVAAGIADNLPGRQQALGSPVPPRWLDAARRYACELRGAGDQVLIHADLHYGNVLAATRQPWLAVDPRALQGVPEYSIPELMWTRADELPYGADIRGIFDVIVAAGELDAAAARGWVVTRCVDYWLWGLQRGLTIDPVRCERVLSALFPGSGN
ncbi:aminoglycoside phosphotransferase family protein [Micromonospora sediminimaris]|uniref:Aminoglycoside O-phosphotransferase n=1 Tax=Micromonospora sediminimaris TaxID=547162 RepID=A0A9W5UWC8_9ACTN|nr:aminoglycoside phosphotransferase family protein [Micromonospora sediminimaris]GIJ34485.1 aminoglycoside O-phosphotransferase [Micromonospora sediminimaris]SFD29320.1 streptomycin 6-kinase [Micromonospora sediminimaris]